MQKVLLGEESEKAAVPVVGRTGKDSTVYNVCTGLGGHVPPSTAEKGDAGKKGVASSIRTRGK